jgi:hypothetical protein
MRSACARLGCCLLALALAVLRARLQCCCLAAHAAVCIRASSCIPTLAGNHNSTVQILERTAAQVDQAAAA